MTGSRGRGRRCDGPAEGAHLDRYADQEEADERLQGRVTTALPQEAGHVARPQVSAPRFPAE
jgi:hypothetical protein